jgi:hypothetical protein
MIPSAGPELLTELNLGVEGAIKGDGAVSLPEAVAGRVVSMYLPYSSDGTRWNVCSTSTSPSPS